MIITLAVSAIAQWIIIFALMMRDHDISEIERKVEGIRLYLTQGGRDGFTK